MITLLLVILFALWVLGYVQIPGLTLPNISLFTLNGRNITLWDILIFVMIIWALEFLPSPLRQIGMILVLVWVLSTLGIFALTGLPSVLVLLIIGGLIFSMFSTAA